MQDSHHSVQFSDTKQKTAQQLGSIALIGTGQLPQHMQGSISTSPQHSQSHQTSAHASPFFGRHMCRGRRSRCCCSFGSCRTSVYKRHGTQPTPAHNPPPSYCAPVLFTPRQGWPTDRHIIFAARLRCYSQTAWERWVQGFRILLSCRLALLSSAAVPALLILSWLLLNLRRLAVIRFNCGVLLCCLWIRAQQASCGAADIDQAHLLPLLHATHKSTGRFGG
jgi:hypothetical protein